MATSDKPKPAPAVPLDILPLIRRSGILGEKGFHDLRARVLRGDYPNDSVALAERLVAQKLLTEYQAQRILAGKSHGFAVGRYIIMDRLGAGSMGRVYKAQHQLMDRVVALKIISPGIVTNERVVHRFQREMRLVGRLDHPNVVRAYDADKIENVLFIVMEYVPGQSLSQLLRSRGPLTPADVINYATQAALGLAHAHVQGIVHRDIKPSNLLVSDSHQLKVLDLGLGVLTDADTQGTFMTADGVTVGTVDYMSPEQACGKELDGRSDLFSLGCSLYHILSGQLPFPGDSQVERLGKRLNEKPIPILDLKPGLPSRLVQALDKLLANKPEDRYQTAEEAAEAFQAIVKKRTPRAAPQQPSASVDGNRNAAPVVVVDAPRISEPAPTYPGWFLPLASLAERSPNLALLAVAGASATIFGLGALAGWFLP